MPHNATIHRLSLAPLVADNPEMDAITLLEAASSVARGERAFSAEEQTLLAATLVRHLHTGDCVTCMLGLRSVAGPAPRQRLLMQMRDAAIRDLYEALQARYPGETNKSLIERMERVCGRVRRLQLPPDDALGALAFEVTAACKALGRHLPAERRLREITNDQKSVLRAA